MDNSVHKILEHTNETTIIITQNDHLLNQLKNFQLSNEENFEELKRKSNLILTTAESLNDDVIKTIKKEQEEMTYNFNQLDKTMSATKMIILEDLGIKYNSMKKDPQANFISRVGEMEEIIGTIPHSDT
jgi:hypothetical protein